ncbi:MAG: TolC family protein [Acidobacteria bacterium]|nr:TolC family protein [Acidobacteriota bacterium]
MGIGMRTIAPCVLVCVSANVTAAQGRPLTLSDVLARARERAPEIVSARLAVEEARGRLAGASLRLQSNPEIDVAVGNRDGTGTRSTDFEFGLAQAFEPRLRRTARIAAVDAAIAGRRADVDHVTRLVLRDALAASYRVLHANERIALLASAFDLANTIYTSADRRYRAGDIAVLDVNIARASLARVRAEREEASARKAAALGELKRLLRTEEDIDVTGSLGPSGQVDLVAALESASARPELRSLEAAIQEAEAEVRLSLTYTKPEYGLDARYSREEGDQILVGGLKIALPAFSRGQEQRAVASARAARLRSDLAAARARGEIEVRAAFETLSRRQAALRILETDALPGLEENAQLATRSFDVGQIGLPELLLIRREILDTRVQFLDALLEAALARADFDASAGLLR